MNIQLTYSEQTLLEEMRNVYIQHCSKMQQHWRKSARYQQLFKDYEAKKVKARGLVTYLQGDLDPDGLVVYSSDQAHGDDPR